MIYMEPHMLGWRPLFLSWLNELPKTIDNDMKDLLSENFERIVPPLLCFVRKSGVKVELDLFYGTVRVECFSSLIRFQIEALMY